MLKCINIVISYVEGTTEANINNASAKITEPETGASAWIAYCSCNLNWRKLLFRFSTVQLSEQVDNPNKIRSQLFQIINGLLYLDIYYDYSGGINHGLCSILRWTNQELFVSLPQPSVKEIKPIKLRSVQPLRRRNRGLPSEGRNLKLLASYQITRWSLKHCPLESLHVAQNMSDFVWLALPALTYTEQQKFNYTL
jgi:hypothetical protein